MLALAIPPLMTTLNPGLAGKPSVGRYSSVVAKFLSRVRLRGVGASATYGGSAAAASSLCAAIGPSASVLFDDEQLAETWAPVVRGLCGQHGRVDGPRGNVQGLGHRGGGTHRTGWNVVRS